MRAYRRNACNVILLSSLVLMVTGCGIVNWSKYEVHKAPVFETDTTGDERVRSQHEKRNESGSLTKSHGECEMVFRTMQAIEFEKDSGTMMETERRDLKTIARELLQNDNITRVLIKGFTDDTGSKKHNRKLGWERAEGVAEELIKSGVRSEIIRIESFGEDFAVGENFTPRGKAINRRVKMYIVEQMCS